MRFCRLPSRDSLAALSANDCLRFSPGNGRLGTGHWTATAALSSQQQQPASRPSIKGQNGAVSCCAVRCGAVHEESSVLLNGREPRSKSQSRSRAVVQSCGMQHGFYVNMAL